MASVDPNETADRVPSPEHRGLYCPGVGSVSCVVFAARQAGTERCTVVCFGRDEGGNCGCGLAQAHGLPLRGARPDRLLLCLSQLRLNVFPFACACSSAVVFCGMALVAPPFGALCISRLLAARSGGLWICARVMRVWNIDLRALCRLL